VNRGAPGRPLRLTIGLADVVTKPMAHRLIRPMLKPPAPVRVVVREDSPEKLLAELVANELDVLILDSPPGPDAGVRVFSHLLSECGVTLLATAELARRYRPRFPKSLDGAPFLLPGRTTGLRRGLDQWFDGHGIRPYVVGEFDDSALVFGASTTWSESGVWMRCDGSYLPSDCRDDSITRPWSHSLLVRAASGFDDSFLLESAGPFSRLVDRMPGGTASGMLQEVLAQYNRSVMERVASAVKQGHRATSFGDEDGLPSAGIRVEFLPISPAKFRPSLHPMVEPLP